MTEMDVPEIERCLCMNNHSLKIRFFRVCSRLRWEVTGHSNNVRSEYANALTWISVYLAMIAIAPILLCARRLGFDDLFSSAYLLKLMYLYKFMPYNPHKPSGLCTRHKTTVYRSLLQIQLASLLCHSSSDEDV